MAESQQRGEVVEQQGGRKSWWTHVIGGLATVLLAIGILIAGTYAYRLLTTQPTAPTATAPAPAPAAGLTAPTVPSQPVAPTGATTQQQQAQATAPPIAGPPTATVPAAQIDNGIGHYATSTVSRAPGATANFYLEPGTEQVGFIGPGKHMPRQVYVYSCPVSQPVQLMSPSPPAAVPTQQKCCCPKPPTPPTPPTPPAPPAS